MFCLIVGTTHYFQKFCGLVGQKQGLWGQTAWVQSLPVLLNSCVTSHRLFNHTSVLPWVDC